MYALDQVLKPDFSRSWHEAVALVQEVAAAVGDLTTLPAPEDLLLEEGGTVSIGFASEVASHPVTALGTLLLQLLEGSTAPAELRSFAAENANTPPAHGTVAGFTRALGFYERPDRQSDVRAVVTRLAARRAAANTEQELELLRKRITSSDEKDNEKNGATVVKLPRVKLPPFSVRQSAVAAAIVVALLGTLAVARLARGRALRAVAPVDTAASVPRAGASSPMPAAADAKEEPSVAPVVQPVHDNGVPASAAALKPAFRPPSPQGDAAPLQGLASPQPKQARQRAVASSILLAALRAPAPLAVRERTEMIAPVWPFPAAAPVLPMRSLSPPAKPLPPSPAEPLAAHVYSAADRYVKPARLTRSQLPQEPAASEDTGYFEIVVDESGDVELIKLISPTRRYQDRMLVAAAKAWKFTPALLNGTPVKYRLRIPIILPDIAR